MTITIRSISRGATPFDSIQDGPPTHLLDGTVQGAYAINTDHHGPIAANTTVTCATRAKVASTDVVVEALADQPLTVAFEDSTDGVAFTQRATFPVAGGRIRTGFRCVITAGSHYRLKATTPNRPDSAASYVSIHSQQRPA